MGFFNLVALSTSLTCITNLPFNVVFFFFKALFLRLPQSRSLPDPVRQEVAELLALSANKKLVKRKVQKERGKVVLLKDLSNIRSANKPTTRNDLEKTVHLLQDTYGIRGV